MHQLDLDGSDRVRVFFFFFMVNSSCFNVKALTVKLCLVYFHLLTITAPEHSHCVLPHPHPIFPSLYSFDVRYQ